MLRLNGAVGYFIDVLPQKKKSYKASPWMKKACLCTIRCNVFQGANEALQTVATIDRFGNPQTCCNTYLCPHMMSFVMYKMYSTFINSSTFSMRLIFGTLHTCASMMFRKGWDAVHREKSAYFDFKANKDV